MSQETPMRSTAAVATADGVERCGCGSEMTPTHDPFGLGDKACVPCRDRALEAQVSGLIVRGIDVYGP